MPSSTPARQEPVVVKAEAARMPVPAPARQDPVVRVQPAKPAAPPPPPALEPVDLEEISALEEVDPKSTQGGDAEDIPLIS